MSDFKLEHSSLLLYPYFRKQTSLKRSSRSKEDDTCIEKMIYVVFIPLYSFERREALELPTLDERRIKTFPGGHDIVSMDQSSRGTPELKNITGNWAREMSERTGGNFFRKIVSIWNKLRKDEVSSWAA